MTDTSLDVKAKPKLKRPKRYTVVFVNDDFTPVDFVITVLVKIFGLSVDDAAEVTMSIHNSGRGNTGTYTLEVAQTKVSQVLDAARHHEFPLTCSAEPL
jgi:ATP-dependent Clp protease adaptor protein ClpS